MAAIAANRAAGWGTRAGRLQGSDHPQPCSDARAALERLIEHPRRKRRSVSWRSLLVLFQQSACHSPELKQHLGGVLTFGNYTNWPEVTCAGHWALTQMDPVIPSKYPVVFKLLSQHWSGIMADGQVDAQWNQYIRSTGTLRSFRQRTNRRWRWTWRHL